MSDKQVHTSHDLKIKWLFTYLERLEKLQGIGFSVTREINAVLKELNEMFGLDIEVKK